MKRAITLICAIIVFIQLPAQSPEKMSFQAVIRNSAGELIKNDNVGIRISILKGSSSGAEVYSETQNVTTNQNGLITLEIGNGIPVSGSFGSITWSDDEYYLKTETDIEGGVNYTITGISQFLSVPYAIHAKTAQNFAETDPEIGNNTTGYSPKWDGSAFVTGSLYQSESGSVGIGTTTPGAILDISSTTSGVLIPRLTTEQRDQITSPAVGLQIFNTTTNCFNVWNGSTWGQICPDCGFFPVPGNNGPICAGLNLELTVVSIPGATYSWTGPEGFTSNLQNPVITSATTSASGAYYVSVTVNGCTSKPVATVATITPSLGASSAAYNAPVCVNGTLNLTTTSIPGASYTWSGPNNFFSNILNPSIPSVQPGHAGTYHVVATMGSCSSSSSVDVIIDPLPVKPGIITGNFSLLSPQTGVNYSVNAVPGAASYTWSYSGSGATITGQGTNSISIDFACGATSGNLSVIANNICGGPGEAQSQPIALSGLTQPQAITGRNTIILPATTVEYSVAAVSGATGYVWNVPSSLGSITSGQGTNSITVDFACGASAGIISVAASNSCGTGPVRNLSVSIASLPTPGTISGPGTITFPQTGVAYSIPSVSGATTYTWTVPAGASITSGQGSNAITVNYACGTSSGNISVVAGNSCSSSGTNSLSVTVTTSTPAMPGAISGANNIPAGVTGMIYSITPVSGATSYLWTVPSGAEISTGQGTTSINVNYLCTAISGNISVIAVNDCGQSSARSLAVTVNSSPSQPGAISGLGSVPQGSTGITYSISTVTGASSYTWSYTGTGATITSGQGTNSVTMSFSCEATNGNITVNASNSCSVPGSERVLGITISGTLPTPGAITGSTTPLTGQQSAPYSVVPVPGAETYSWAVPGGATITSGQGTNSITVDYGCSAVAGNISLTVSNSCIAAGTPRTLAITPGTSITQPGVITGLTSVPQGKTGVVYSIDDVPGATTYTWSYTGSGVTFASGQGTKTVSVDFGCTATTGNISVTAANACIPSGTARTLTITVNPLSIPGTITGSASIPQGSTGLSYSVTPVAGATSYTWLVPVGAMIVHGQGTNSILVDYGCAVGNGNILVTADNACGSSGGSSLNITITANKPATPGGISSSVGSTIPKGLKNVVHSIALVPGAASYTWTVPAGGNIVSGQGSNSIVVDYSCSAVPGNVSVVSNNTCGSSTPASLYMNITAAPPQPGGITGTSSVPKGSSGFTYTISPVNGANLYTWTVPAGASITSGQGTTTIRVDYSCSAVSGNIIVNASNLCGNVSTNSTLGITITSAIGTLGSITGATSPVYGQTGIVYSVTPVTGVTNYTWSVPGDAIISSGQGTSSIKVDFPCTATNGTIQVSASNGCSATTPVSLSFALSSAPLQQPGAITGPASVAKGTTAVVYSISPVNGATSYNWTVPANCTITSGQGTQSITVNFADCNVTSGNITVTAESGCVSASPAQNLAVTVTTTALPTPGAITGLQTPVQGQKEIVYSITDVQGATSYTWSYSGTGLNIISGQGTKSILVEYLCGATNGNINVTASNGCAATSTAQTLSITPGNSLGTTGAVSGSQAPKYGETSLVYSTVPIPGATAYTWTVSPGVTIVSGQGTPSIIVNFSCSAQATGTIRVAASNSCSLQALPSALSYAMAGSLSAPGTISGPGSLPKGSTGIVYAVSAVNGATSYTWSVPSGFTIASGQGTNTINVDAGCSALAGSIIVSATNSCETTAESSLPVTILSTLPVPGSISGTASPANGAAVNYSIVAIPGASMYNWTAPAGATVVNGEGTNSVWYTFGCGASAGNVSVTISNSCIAAGTASTIAVTPQAAAPITTVSNITEAVVAGTNNRRYSVAPAGNALYSWAVPGGMTIVSGQGTTEIVTSFTGTVSGNVSVTASNICLTQSSSSTLIVNVSDGVYFLATGQGQYGTIQSWTVPEGVTTITIEARGAQGGSSYLPGGLGAKMKGTFAVTPGQVLKILVGQAGTSTSSYPGGGGGTFVTDIENSPMIIAGGGGANNNHGVITTAGSGTGAGISGAGGTPGGGGMFSSGSDGCNGAGGGKSFISGGFGGNAGGNGVPGGFGGGSGSGRYSSYGSSCTVYGSGGGYSGGGNSGGGGSFNSGSNQNNAPGFQSGDGMVVITW